MESQTSFLRVVRFDNDELLKQCVEDIQEQLLEYPSIWIGGKECHQRRHVGFFSNVSEGYKYSGQMAKSKPLTLNLSMLLECINKMYDAGFNGILVNRYMDGNDYITAHSDDMRNVDSIGVVSLSFGAERIFRIRNKITKEIMLNLPIRHGELIHMGGDFQKEFTHEIPKQTRIKDCRISFTFRNHK